MLTHLDLFHFKCFEQLKLPLAPLTLLSGSNASGKSSALQALVLLHQTMREQEWSTRLMLNGNSIGLGTVADVVDQVHGRRSFQISATDEGRSYLWKFVGERTEMSMSVDAVSIDGVLTKKLDMLRYLLPHKVDLQGKSFAERLLGLTYITAERLGPREVYNLEDRQAATVVGPAGENAVSVLHWGRDEEVLKELLISNVPNTRIRQVEACMRMFFPGCSILLQQIPQANAVTLGIRTSNDTEFLRPIHVGFGLTQVFPIVVAALSSSKGDILLIENPEVHLHPAGQAMMGQFLASVANAGVQVIVETHSDHVLNGIRRSVKAEQLSSDKVVIHFFRPRSEGKAQVISPQLDPSGNVDSWPEGFFDQFDKDMNFFAGWGE
jgi:predicted ATPase